MSVGSDSNRQKNGRTSLSARNGVSDSTVSYFFVSVKDVVAELESEPLVPFTVSVNVPVGELEAVVTVMVVLPEPVTEVGLNDADDLEGRPVTLNVTVPLKPEAPVTVTA